MPNYLENDRLIEKAIDEILKDRPASYLPSLYPLAIESQKDGMQGGYHWTAIAPPYALREQKAIAFANMDDMRVMYPQIIKDLIEERIKQHESAQSQKKV